MNAQETEPPTQDDLEDAPDGVGAHHLDAPLARTLVFEALSKRPTGRQIAEVQRHAAAGRYGRGWRRAVESRSPRPSSMAMFVGGVVAVPFLIAVVVAVVQGDSETALFGLGATAVVTVVAGGLGYWGAAAARRRRWRRHARAALFAEANGLQLRLFAHQDVLPAAVRWRPGDVRLQSLHADVMSARVGGLLLMTGTRTTDVRRGESTSTFHQLWAGLRLEGAPADDGSEPHWAELRAWCTRQVRRDAVELTIGNGWLVLATEGLRDDLPVLETLMAGIDLALALIEEGAAGSGSDDVRDAPV
ncbi:hypothetical protein [Serinibacter arcticus]|uniref:hypothetical protein n=1 Tax=Serinibacter arcticus TaxID=1655435 RepID=UPI001092360E|nr:hypothetical protein [Serinibacter arcticus]